MRYIFDIETDGLLDSVTKIHSLVLINYDTGMRTSCANAQGYQSIEAGLRLLSEATQLIGHNVLKFDIPVIKKLYPSWDTSATVVDTLLCARLIWPDTEASDHIAVKTKGFPGKLIGSHSLKAWGYRLGIQKGKFGEETDWGKWSVQMQEYCEQDCAVTRALFEFIRSQNYSDEAIRLEHAFANVIIKMENRGFCFNEPAAVDLYGVLLTKKTEVEQRLAVAFPPDEVTTISPKKKIKRTKMVPFNPGSRVQIADRLKRLGWVPTKTTETGLAQVDDTILEALPYPEAKLLAEYLLVAKRIGQLATGQQAWMKKTKAGRAYYSVNTNRAVTGRCGHHDFNIAQVPRVGSPFGKECRALFTASPGMVLVGADASGLELRALGGYLAYYDSGKYAAIVSDPSADIHTVNQAAFGLPPGKPGRQLAKNGIYALVYGAANEKLGETLERLASAHESAAMMLDVPQWARRSMLRDGAITQERVANWKRGAYARDRVVKNIEGFGSLVADVAAAVSERQFLRGLDGRKLGVRSSHAALNTLLQSAGALIVKKATVIWYETLTAAGLVWGKDFALVAHVHDEIQAECLPQHADLVGRTFVEAIKKAGEMWQFRCPLSGEYKVGNNWADTH